MPFSGYKNRKESIMTDSVTPILMWAAGIITVLISVIWALTWGTTNRRIDLHDRRIEKVESCQGKLETEQELLKQELGFIRKSVEKLVEYQEEKR